ncbi:MAG: hypothetical protein M1544_03145 [Candidatus Marsarchaeota archaeon]|nr:hypothetical protein [Candidatus Marsarchaeota archaeon]MCL5102324.1 hypothetical protein [Candidatus Marsarchaeota archaeon]
MNFKKSYLADRRIIALIIVFVALAILDVHYGLHFGIEFVGGTQIPVTLQKSVNATEMDSIISTIDQRVSTFGLKQVTVEGVGSSEIYVSLPSVSASEINKTASIIESQGKFLGVVNGVQAINGSGILPGSIGIVPPSAINNTVEWQVTFFITDSAAKAFAKAVFGQANKPLYMFLDRPSGTIILMNGSMLGNASAGVSASEAESAIKNALAYNKDPIPLIVVYNNNASISAAESYINASRRSYTQIFASYNLPGSLISYAKSLNYTVKLESKANMTPSFTELAVGNFTLNTWPLVGLLSSPQLNPSITNGSVGDSYEISGAAPSTLSYAQKISYADNISKTISSILTGGALPVQVVVGTPTSIPPTLGKSSLDISIIALITAMVLVSIFIVVRYRRVFLVGPILITTLLELFIIISIIGLVGTIDLSAFAGMIAVVGTGVDAQIIITDEILSRKNTSEGAKSILGNAFYIVWADAALLIIAMLPLFFSTSLVEVIGFSESTIIGALMGVLVTRPAYGAIVSRHYVSD